MPIGTKPVRFAVAQRGGRHKDAAEPEAAKLMQHAFEKNNAVPRLDGILGKVDSCYKAPSFALFR